MSKMGLHDPFGHLTHKLWPKERLRVKLAIWLPTTKNRESTRLPCMQVPCNIPLESSQRGLQLCFKPHLNQRSAHKVIEPQSRKSLILGISRLPFESLGTKCHLDVGIAKRHKVYYKGEGGGFPQVQVVVSLVSPSLPMAHSSTESVQTTH
jgi:hypothetical protein